MSKSLADIQLSEQRYDQLAADMIALLRANGDEAGADFAQSALDEDGSGTAVNTVSSTSSTVVSTPRL